MVSSATDYQLHQGTERKLLQQFMEQTYRELYPELTDFNSLGFWLSQFYPHAPDWWWVAGDRTPVGCLWIATAKTPPQIQLTSQILLLYVAPEHRRRGIATMLMQQAENWAKAQGHPQIGLQTLVTNQTAMQFYQHLGYTTSAAFLVKSLTN